MDHVSVHNSVNLTFLNALKISAIILIPLTKFDLDQACVSILVERLEVEIFGLKKALNEVRGIRGGILPFGFKEAFKEGRGIMGD